MTAKLKGYRQQQVLSYMKSHGACTAREIAEATGIPLTGPYGGVYRILHTLSDAGAIFKVAHLHPSIYIVEITE